MTCALCPLFQAPQGPSPGAPGQGPHPYSLAEPALTLETSGKNLTEQNNYSNIPHEGKHTPLYERSSPINPAPSSSPNHVDSAYFPGSSTSSSSDNDEGSGGAAKWVVGFLCSSFFEKPPADCLAGWLACGTECCAQRCGLLQVGEGHFVPVLGLLRHGRERLLDISTGLPRLKVCSTGLCGLDPFLFWIGVLGKLVFVIIKRGGVVWSSAANLDSLWYLLLFFPNVHIRKHFKMPCGFQSLSSWTSENSEFPLPFFFLLSLKTHRTILEITLFTQQNPRKLPDSGWSSPRKEYLFKKIFF